MSATPSIQWNELEKRHSQLQARVAELERRLGDASSELASRAAAVTSLRQSLDVEKSSVAKHRLEVEVHHLPFFLFFLFLHSKCFFILFSLINLFQIIQNNKQKIRLGIATHR